MLQGVLIGAVGSAVGLIVGYSICYFAGKYHWIKLPEAVYPISYLPFEARWMDGIWIAGVAILVSFLATIYPAKSATTDRAGGSIAVRISLFTAEAQKRGET